VDEEAVTHPTPRKAEASFTSVLRDKPVAPARFTPQMLFEAENPKVRLMCDLNKIYVANREFTFEEIRQQCYQRNGSSRAAKISKVLIPLDEEPVRVPLKPKVVEPEVKVDRVATPSQPIATPVFNPHEHLKPNERLHCHVEEMYTADGKEFSMEQLRARVYARKLEKRAKEIPEVKAPEVEAPDVMVPEVKAPAAVSEVRKTSAFVDISSSTKNSIFFYKDSCSSSSCHARCLHSDGFGRTGIRHRARPQSQTCSVSMNNFSSRKANF
jgi:hypothetical protein